MMETVIGSALKKARKDANMSLREVGEKLGLSITYLWTLEHGGANPKKGSTLTKISAFVNMPVDDLRPDWKARALAAEKKLEVAGVRIFALEAEVNEMGRIIRELSK